MQGGHYVRTPYSDRSLLARKYVPSLTIDLGQGLLQLIDEIRDADTETNQQAQ